MGLVDDFPPFPAGDGLFFPDTMLVLLVCLESCLPQAMQWSSKAKINARFLSTLMVCCLFQQRIDVTPHNIALLLNKEVQIANIFFSSRQFQ